VSTFGNYQTHYQEERTDLEKSSGSTLLSAKTFQHTLRAFFFQAPQERLSPNKLSPQIFQPQQREIKQQLYENHRMDNYHTTKRVSTGTNSPLTTKSTNIAPLSSRHTFGN